MQKATAARANSSRPKGRPPGTPNPSGGRTAKPAEKSLIVQVYCPPALMDAVTKAARREGRSVSGFVVSVLAQYFQENKI